MRRLPDGQPTHLQVPRLPWRRAELHHRASVHARGRQPGPTRSSGRDRASLGPLRERALKERPRQTASLSRRLLPLTEIATHSAQKTAYRRAVLQTETIFYFPRAYPPKRSARVRPVPRWAPPQLQVYYRGLFE